MAKIVVKKLNPVRLGKAAARAVGKKRVPTVDGGWKTVRTLDVYHPNFDDAQLYVFRSNVARARRENKKAFGVADFVPPKR